ncbi:hypothetical protein [Rhodococcus sp. NPDC003322]
MSALTRSAGRLCAVAAAILLGLGAPYSSAAAAGLPAPTAAPSGGYWYFHYLAERCEAGSMQACDSLTTQTTLKASETMWQTYNRYGRSCGGRTEPNPYQAPRTSCVQQFPEGA